MAARSAGRLGVDEWKAEAEAFVAWRDAVWAYALQELARVVDGEREPPTIDGFIGELPKINWPAVRSA